MSFQRKMIVVALASAMPWMSAHAQSAADLKKEIEALKAQLLMLTQKVEQMDSKAASPELVQQVNRIEQKQELASDDHEKSGFKGLKINGAIEAAFKYDDVSKSSAFSSSAGYYDEFAMLQITKESQDGEGVDWTLRLLPGSSTYNHVHEASVSIPFSKEHRIIGGLIPDFQGYEYSFVNANSTLGNQLLTHNALFDLAGATTYAGIGMSHTFANGTYALKWLVGNIDPANDDTANNVTDANGNPIETVTSSKKSSGLAFRGDWYINEYAYVGFSGAMASANRNFSIFAVDGGFTRGDWQFNGQLTSGAMRNAAANGGEATWTGVSSFMAYKATPRLQLLARADYIDNRSNGGGTYVDYAGSSGQYGLGPEKDEAGGMALDANGLPTTGANLTRLTLGTNYQINSSTQWKTEIRMDQSSGYNFFVDGSPSKVKNSIGTSFVLSF